MAKEGDATNPSSIRSSFTRWILNGYRRVYSSSERLLGGFEMEFCRAAQGVGAVLLDEGAGGFENSSRGALGKFDSPFFFGGGEPIDELFAGQDGCGGDGIVAFGFGLLAELDLASALHEGALEDARVGELVAEGGRAIGLSLAEVFDHPGMAPSEEAVEVADFFVERIVFFRRDDDDLADEPRRGADDFGQLADLCVGADGFAVADAGFEEMAGDGFFRVSTGDDERTEEVAFAAFIDAEVRGKTLGVVDLLVAEARFTEDFGFECELDEIFGVLALDDGFRSFFVNGHGHSGFLPEVKGVRSRLEFEPLLDEKGAQLVRLFGGQDHGVGSERRHRVAKGVIAGLASVEQLGLCAGRPVCFDATVNKERFGQRLRTWFRRHGRDLPWRRTRDPYAVLVSEMMLQQTTVAAVVPYYERWMKRFPSVHELAAAEESEVLALWQGLGYYRRARNLHAAAKRIVKESGGEFSSDYDSLRGLPGIGDYTAQAVRAFAYDEPVTVLDANVIRVVARVFDIRTPVDTAKGLAEVRSEMEGLLPSKNGREFVSAIMELGALVCRAGRPDCLLCPVKQFCMAEVPEMLPVKAPKPPVKARTEHAAWVSDGQTLMLQQSTARRWVGLWRLPPLEKQPSACASTELTYSIVRERVRLRVHSVRRSAVAASAEPRRAFPFQELEDIAIPSPHRRAIARMLRQSHS